MKVPISWLKEYVDIKLPPKELMWKMTEVGLTSESFEKVGEDIILDIEVTPNRPDWMSIIGVAREIAAIQNTKVNFPKITDPLPPEAKLPIKINQDFELCPRFSAITIKDVTQKPSPGWMRDRLMKVGLRPINNLVDTTNYVMFEMGNPIHVFDYDKLHHGEMTIMKSIGGEYFVSVDETPYYLPENAIIFKSGNIVVDLCGIKGGANSGITSSTRNILILVAIYNGQLIRRTSQRMSLWSEASRIFERGANAGGTLDTLKRATNLMLTLSDGTISSDIIDVKKEDFKPWKVSVNLSRLEKILGIKIPDKEIMSIFRRLNISPVLLNAAVECTIPSYRADIQIEEDLIEEVARIYGYNNFPKTLPVGQIPSYTVPYHKDYGIDQKVKYLLTAAGYSEIQTYSLISELDLKEISISSEDVLRVDNPISREYEYLRPTLRPNLLKALKQNKPYFTGINLFELGKVYVGKNVKEAKEEYLVAGITDAKNYLEVKGLLERIFAVFQVEENPTKYIEILGEGVYFAFPYILITGKPRSLRPFVPIPKYPPIIEDMAFILPSGVKVGDVMALIKKQSSIIKDVLLYDKYQDARTFRITYQHQEKNLTTEDVEPIRKKIIKTLQGKFLAQSK